MRDFGPVEMARRNYIFDTIRQVYALYGYRQNRDSYDGAALYPPR